MPHSDDVLHPATLADLDGVPAEQRAEFIEDTLFLCPRPSGVHSLVASRLGGRVDGPFGLGDGGPGGFWILDAPEVHLGKNVVVPDLSGWRVERMSEPPADHRFTIAPDWVCEVLSASTATHDRIRKMRLYAAAGVGHVWLIDPVARTLEVFRRGTDEPWHVIGLHEEAERVRAEPFQAIEIDLALLWKKPRPAAADGPPPRI
ncbi:Uma2 family endonuclease [Chondromyces crocatus]|uniref:Putative restriction endonuclease domain-containing protein n=1 Tax=Chondromyces crocatus TaxID=52 RepID=A0A0K1EET0_CHOCO|nr:Uma2 family endonuclease [Chondromyces crocatus]AKT39364.1 uncharacterized protein CMC5_035110 [Chondromyces crocatus]